MDFIRLLPCKSFGKQHASNEACPQFGKHPNETISEHNANSSSHSPTPPSFITNAEIFSFEDMKNNIWLRIHAEVIGYFIVITGAIYVLNWSEGNEFSATWYLVAGIFSVYFTMANVGDRLSKKIENLERKIQMKGMESKLSKSHPDL